MSQWIITVSNWYTDVITICVLNNEIHGTIFIYLIQFESKVYLLKYTGDVVFSKICKLNSILSYKNTKKKLMDIIFLSNYEFW